MAKELVTAFDRRMKVRCHACGCTLQFGSLKKHKETFKHLENVYNTRQEEAIEQHLESLSL